MASRVPAIIAVLFNFFPILAFGEAAVSPQDIGNVLSVVWKSRGSEQALKTWGVAELGKGFRKIHSQEKDPSNEAIVHWKGVLLSQLIEKAIESLPPETRAQVDLVVLTSTTGDQAIIPRSLVVKYPMMVAIEREKKALENFQIVVPWTSKPKIMTEYLPVENYFIARLGKIELANYRDRYANLYLQRRTDPSAMRGEKIFVQNCTSCHAAGKGPSIDVLPHESKVRTLASTGHPAVKGTPKLTEKDRRALASYLDAFRSQNPQSLKTQ